MVGIARRPDETPDERYRRLLEQSGVGLFQTRVDGGIDWLNNTAARLFGYDDADGFMAAVSDVRDLYVDPTRRDALLRLLERDGEVGGFEYEMRRKDGSRRWLSITARARHGARGELEGFEGTFLDVTERKLFEAAAQAMSSDLEPREAVAAFARVLRHAVPFQQLSLVAIQDDRYLRLVSLSGSESHAALPAGASIPLAGSPVGEAVSTGRPVVVGTTSDDAWELNAVLRAAGVDSYVVLPLSDGARVVATFNVGFAEDAPIDQDKIDLLVAHTAAVSHAVQNILLFEAQRDVVRRLEEVGRLKNEFLAAVSHDLKNPMSVVAGIAEVLKASWDSVAPERRQKMLDTMLANARAMGDMLQRDLDIALIESGELTYEIEPFDLVEGVSFVVSGFREAEPGRDFVLDAESDLPPAMGDRRRHAQVLYNLLSNAVKFSDPGEPVTVVVRLTGAMLVVTVGDRGPGIAEEDQEVLFQRLSRLDAAKPGTGLGLYLAQAMIESQGGTISVESEPGAGSRFSYALPTAP